MPNPEPDTQGLTKGNAKALEALGVEALEEGEVSYTLRVRTGEAVRGWVRDLGPRKAGELLEEAYRETHERTVTKGGIEKGS